MNKITQKIALGLLVSGVAFSGMVSSSQAMDLFKAILADQPGCNKAKVTALTSEEARVLISGDGATATKSLAKQVGDLKLLSSAVVDAPKEVPSHLKLKVVAELVDTYQDAIGKLAGVNTIEQLTAEKRQDALMIASLDLPLNDPAANLTVQQIRALAGLVGSPHFATEEARNAYFQFAHEERTNARAFDVATIGPRVNMVTKAPIANFAIDRHADHAAAKAQLENVGGVNHVEKHHPDGLDISTLAAWMVQGTNNPTVPQFALIKGLLTGMSRDAELRNVPVTRDLVNTAERINRINPAVSLATLGEKKFSEMVVAATYLEFNLQYPPIDPMDPVHVERLKRSEYALEVLKALNLYNPKARNTFQAVATEYADAMMQMLNPAVRAAVLGNANVVPTLNDTLVMTMLREADIRNVRNRHGNTLITAADFTQQLKDVAARFAAHPKRYVTSLQQALTEPRRAAIALLDALHIPDETIVPNDVQIAERMVALRAGGLGQDLNHFNALRDLKAAGLNLATIPQVQVDAVVAVRAVSPEIALKVIRKMRAQIANPNYVPAGAAVFTGRHGGGDALLDIVAPLDRGGYTANAARRAGGHIQVSNGDLPVKGDGTRNYLAGDIVFFDDIADNGGVVNNVTFNNGDAGIN